MIKEQLPDMMELLFRYRSQNKIQWFVLSYTLWYGSLGKNGDGTCIAMVEEMVHIKKIPKAALVAIDPFKTPWSINHTCLLLLPVDLPPKNVFVLWRVDVADGHLVWGLFPLCGIFLCISTISKCSVVW